MNDTQFINRINAVLAEKGIEKRIFYADCKITSSAFSQWATGRTTPREKKLREIAEYLGVSYDFLIHGQKENPPSVDDGLDAERNEWLTAWEKATPSQRKAALAVLMLQVPTDEQ